MSIGIVLAQVPSKVGDIEACGKRVEEICAAHCEDCVVFPEMFLSGYPPCDVVLRESFVVACRKEAERLARCVENPAVFLPMPWRRGGDLLNAVAVLRGGKVECVIGKSCLPNEGVFDEKRYFVSSSLSSPLKIGGVRIQVLICEDIWQESLCTTLAERLEGIDLVLVVNGSPFESGKDAMRRALLRKRQQAFSVPILYLNATGAQDEIVFDGGSFLISDEQEVKAPFFRSCLLCTRWEKSHNKLCLQGVKTKALSVGFTPCTLLNFSSALSLVYGALVEGLGQYMERCGFEKVVLGLSGGIDSALCASVCVDAVGCDRVEGIFLKTRFNPPSTYRDVQDIARRLGIRLRVLDIEDLRCEIRELLESFAVEGIGKEIAEQNQQARLRGLCLMAVSNFTGSLVVCSSNKSELASGYATLYGDMIGGYSPLKDVYKTGVYELARFRNGYEEERGGEGFFSSLVLLKAPSAELAEGQRDEEALPPYEVLDRILFLLIEEGLGVEEVIERGEEESVVRKVANDLFSSEYKRYQSPPGVKVTRCAFGRDWRYPLAGSRVGWGLVGERRRRKKG